jgi:hypothetical protein
MSNKVINSIPIKLGIYDTTTDSTLLADLGAINELEDGRKFRLCRNSTAAALVPGKAVQAPAENTYDEDIAIGTAAIGDTTLDVTVHASYGATVAANDFAEGYFCVGAGSGELGHGRKIKSNTAATVGNDTTLTFYDALTDTISASSTGAWCKSPFNNVVIDAGTGRVVGVPVCDVTISTSSGYYYFWAQVAGPCSMVSGGAIVAGDNVMSSSGTAIATTGTTPETIGTAMQAFDSGDAGWVWLNLE